MVSKKRIIVALDTIDTNFVSAITCNDGEMFTMSYEVSNGTLTNGEVTIYDDFGGVAIPTFVLVNGTSSGTLELGEGDYVITVFNPATGCELSEDYEVLPVPSYVIDASAISSVDCLGSETGSATVSINISETIQAVIVIQY